MAVVRILPRAELDIEELFAYLADFSDRAADRLVHEIESVANRLAIYPESGSPREEFGTDTRVVPMPGLGVNVFYLVVSNGKSVVTILRVLRQERDVDEARVA